MVGIRRSTCLPFGGRPFIPPRPIESPRIIVDCGHRGRAAAFGLEREPTAKRADIQYGFASKVGPVHQRSFLGEPRTAFSLSLDEEVAEIDAVPDHLSLASPS